jgi:uncharacterized protein with HEPN domain
MRKNDFVYLRHILDAVWDTVKKDIPALKNRLGDIIEKEKKK